MILPDELSNISRWHATDRLSIDSANDVMQSQSGCIGSRIQVDSTNSHWTNPTDWKAQPASCTTLNYHLWKYK